METKEQKIYRDYASRDDEQSPQPGLNCFENGSIWYN